MTTVADFDEYTDVNGVVLIDGVVLADVQYDVKWERATVKVPCAGAIADKNLPGKVSVTTRLKKVLVHSDAAKMIGYSLNEAALTGAAEELKTGVALDADGYTAMADTEIAAPSRVQATVVTSAITTGGTMVIIGADANGNPIQEAVAISTLSVGETAIGSMLFSTVYGVAVYGVRSAGNGTLTIASIAGASAYTVGNPKIFDLVGKVVKGTKTIQITQPDCWFTNGGLAWTEGNTPIDVDLGVEMHNPALLEVDVVD